MNTREINELREIGLDAYGSTGSGNILGDTVHDAALRGVQCCTIEGYLPKETLLLIGSELKPEQPH